MQSDVIHLIVGLGNPGETYAKTRHNAGFLFLERLLARHGNGEELKPQKQLFGNAAKVSLGDRSVRLLAPTTFMNRSGQSVQAALNFYKLSPANCLVIHDELDLDPGVVRLKLGGGHGGNNGLRDITQRLGTGDYPRLRIGIGHPGVGRDVSGYVLKRANKDDEARIDLAIDSAISVLTDVVAGDFARAMNELHSR